MIGNGTNFSWTSTGGIVGTSTRGWLYLNNGGSDTFSDAFSGNGLLTKKGLGTVTLAAAQTNKNLPTNTVIEAGTLRYGVSGALASGAGAGVVDIFASGFLDLNNFSATLNGLTSGGCVTNSGGSAVVLQVGSDTLPSVFSGRLASPITLTKIGTNSLALTHPNPTREAVAVSAGTLALGPSTALTNGVTLASNAVVQAFGYQGLRGEYYDNVFPPGGGVDWPALGTTPAAVDAILSGRVPELVTGSGNFGASFDSTTNGAAFPGKYSGAVDYFVARWTGVFKAETAGLYAFTIFGDDGCMLFIDGTLVVNNRTGGATAAGSTTLAQGDHDVMIFFFERSGLQVLRIWMTPPGGTSALLPQRLLGVRPSTVSGVAGAGGSRLAATDYAELDIVQATTASVGGFSGAGLTNAVIKKSGAGVLTLTDTSSFRGVTRIVEGGLTLASGVSHTGVFDVVSGTLTVSGGTNVDTAPVLIGALSAAASGQLALAAKTVLRVNQTTNGTFAGTLTGGTADSVIAKDGAAELVIASDVSAYPGTWEVMAGNLVIGAGGLLASNAAVATRTGGALVFRSPTNLVFAGTVSGTGAVRNEGPGTLTLKGASTSGIQVAPGQTVILDGAAVAGIATLAGACNNQGTLIFNTPGTIRLSAPITGGGTVRVGAATTLLVGQGGFTDSQSMLLEGGTLRLNNGGALGFDDTMWVTTGVTRFMDDGSGGKLLELNPNLGNTRGAAYYRERVRTIDPWVIDFTFRMGAPGGCGGGDGFGVFFQNDSRGTAALPTGGWYGSVSPYSPSFGFQYYLMPNTCYLAWVENGTLVGRTETNLFAQSKGPFTARMTFDGTKMVVDMLQGATAYSMTNLNAGARLAAVGTNAWMGVVGGTGGCYGQQLIDAFAFTYTDAAARNFTNGLELAAGTASTVEGASSSATGLPLVVGNVAFGAGSLLDAVPAAGTNPNLVFIRFGNLNVLGNSALTVAPEGQAALGGAVWTFKPWSLLTLTGTVTVPSVVHIAIDGAIPRGRMNVVDFRSANVSNLAGVTFVLDGGDGKTFLIYREGWLYTSRTLGTLILLR
jgi:autotransporter-associated beta strand protein